MEGGQNQSLLGFSTFVAIFSVVCVLPETFRVFSPFALSFLTSDTGFQHLCEITDK